MEEQPYHNVMLTNSSFAPTESPSSHEQTPRESLLTQRSSEPTKPASAFLLPSFQYVPTIPTDSNSVESLIKAYILPSQLHQSHERLTRAEKNVLLRQPEMQRQFVGSRKIDEILVLICGHSTYTCGQRPNYA